MTRQKNLMINIEEALVDVEGSVIEVLLQNSLRDLPGRRSVKEGQWGETKIVLKRYFPHSKQDRDARREWENLKQLQELGITVPPPLFWGRESAGSQVVGISYIENATTLQDFLRGSRTESEHLTIFRELMEALAAQHAVGVYQKDHHLGNYLWDGKTLFVLDAATFEFHPPPLRFSSRTRDLALLFANMDLLREESLWQTFPFYFNNNPDQESKDKIWKALERRIPRVRQKRLLRYLKKTHRSCSAFTRIEQGGTLFLCDRKLSPSLKKKLKEEPDRLLENGTMVKDGNTATVAEFVEDNTPYIIKRYNRKPLFYRIRHIFSTSRALKSWSNGLGWRLFGLPTPHPLACLEERPGLLLKRAFLLLEKESGKPLQKFVGDHLEEDESLEKLGLQFSQIWRALGKFRASHGDMKASNFHVSANGQITLIDFDDFRFYSPVFVYKRRRKKDRQRFMKNWGKYPQAEAVFQAHMGKD